MDIGPKRVSDRSRDRRVLPSPLGVAILANSPAWHRRERARRSAARHRIKAARRAGHLRRPTDSWRLTSHHSVPEYRELSRMGKQGQQAYKGKGWQGGGYGSAGWYGNQWKQWQTSAETGQRWNTPDPLKMSYSQVVLVDQEAEPEDKSQEMPECCRKEVAGVEDTEDDDTFLVLLRRGHDDPDADREIDDEICDWRWWFWLSQALETATRTAALLSTLGLCRLLLFAIPKTGGSCNADPIIRCGRSALAGASIGFVFAACMCLQVEATRTPWNYLEPIGLHEQMAMAVQRNPQPVYDDGYTQLPVYTHHPPENHWFQDQFWEDDGEGDDADNVQQIEEV